MSALRRPVVAQGRLGFGATGSVTPPACNSPTQPPPPGYGSTCNGRPREPALQVMERERTARGLARAALV